MQRKKKWYLLSGSAALVFALLMLGVTASSAQETPEGDVLRGGLLYHSWDQVLDVSLPEQNQPLWQEFSPDGEYDPRSWRCVTCHGWDYLGSDGSMERAIVKRAGNPGLFSMVAEPPEVIFTWLDGTENTGHDFSMFLSEEDMQDLSAFLSSGLIAPELIANPETRRVQGTPATGETIFGEYCLSCHNTDGSKINLGETSNPLYLADVSWANPWRVAHVIRFGHLRVNMPPAEAVNLSFSQQIDLLAYLQTLPQARLIGSDDFPVIEYEFQANTEMLAYAAMVLVVLILGAAVWVTRRQAPGPEA